MRTRSLILIEVAAARRFLWNATKEKTAHFEIVRPKNQRELYQDSKVESKQSETLQSSVSSRH